MNLANRVQSLRKIKGVSQEQLAEEMGVSRQAVSKWESNQSTPDLDKIIFMSEYFDVTTDYIIKGMEEPKHLENKNYHAGKILFIASTAFLVIGLFIAFTGWYEDQSADSILAAIIIQVVGIVAYFIGKVISQTKASLIIIWLNIIIVLFIPISMIVTFILNSMASPYPTSMLSSFVFGIGYIITILLTSFIVIRLRK